MQYKKNGFLLSILIVLAMLMTPQLRAQHSSHSSNLGIKASLNSYTLAGENLGSTDSRYGFNLGLVGHLHSESSEHFALQPEVVYSTQGVRGSRSLNLDYINAPILFQYMYDNGFRLQIGPQASFLIEATEGSDNETDVVGTYNRVSLAGVAGVSYINPNTAWGIDARYVFGLTDIDASSDVTAYNRGLELGVFYLIPY